jgi:hypothetical protein
MDATEDLETSMKQSIKKSTIWCFVMAMVLVPNPVLNGQETPIILDCKGQVLSEEGLPISGVYVLADQPGAIAKTDNGGFYRMQITANSLQPDCCVIRFRKPGYGTLTKTIDMGIHQIDVMLAHEASKWAPAPCNASILNKLLGWRMKLLLPKDAIVSEIREVDYVAITIHFDHSGSYQRIEIGSGPIWSTGFPSKKILASSKTFSEKEIAVDGWSDFRGLDFLGKRWRYFGSVEESITYTSIDDSVAAIFDKIIDTACLDTSGKFSSAGFLNADHGINNLRQK